MKYLILLILPGLFVAHTFYDWLQIPQEVRKRARGLTFGNYLATSAYYFWWDFAGRKLVYSRHWTYRLYSWVRRKLEKMNEALRTL